jgi:hypothetical protein
MSTEITTTTVARIQTLAAELEALGRTALGKAVEAGNLLRECKAARAHGDWLKERLGIDYYDFDPGKAPLRLRKPATPAKPIQWPAELIEGTSATWKAFADLREILAKEIESFIDSDELIRMRAIESAERETLANTNLEDLLP